VVCCRRLHARQHYRPGAGLTGAKGHTTRTRHDDQKACVWPQPATSQVAIVTGAGRGIGRGIALAYGAAGIKVAVVSRTQKTVDGVTEEIRKAGGTALGVTCNVGDREAVFAMVDRVASQLGRVDILVNNAQGHGPADNRRPHRSCNPWKPLTRASGSTLSARA
jgi:hypothetical protein